VTLFAFDLGQELSEHTAPYDALAHVLEGQAEIRLGGNPFVLHAGDAIVMPANVPHALKALPASKCCDRLFRVAALLLVRGIEATTTRCRFVRLEPHH
jgi:quercetin dioxygenase-like cupin family protein